MAKKLKVYLPEQNIQVETMFKQHNYTIVKSIKACDIVVFTGGADVSPNLYGQHTHPLTSCGEMAEKRDDLEAAIFEEAQELNKYCVGICRGGQLLNVLNGGQMWQHVDGHALGGRHHKLYDTVEDKFIKVSSTHHQMMIPHKSAEIVATGNESANLSMCSQKESGYQAVSVKPIEEWTDIEVLLYDTTSSLCFQPHPEYGPKECTDYFFKLLDLIIK